MEIKSLIEYALFRALIFKLRLLPYSYTRAFLQRLAGFTGNKLRIRREVVSRQISLVYPDINSDDLATTINQVYAHLGLVCAEIFFTNPKTQLEQVTVSPGWDTIDQALALGKGAILATGHIGNFELGGAFVADRYRLLDVVKPQRNQYFDAFIERRRNEQGLATVPMDQAAKAVLAQLRSGGLVSLLIDQDAGARGMPTDFLGVPASTWPGIARFSIRTGCPVIPVAMRRLPDNQHLFLIGDPLLPGGLSDQPGEVQEYLQRISTAVESFILAEPHQWFWVHRRWKGASEAKYE